MANLFGGMLRLMQLAAKPANPAAGESRLYFKNDSQHYWLSSDGVENQAASTGYVQSRGTDLVTNGTGYLKKNTNFSTMVYEPTDAPTGITGSFRGVNPNAQGSPFCDEFIPIDPAKRFQFAFWARQRNGAGALYGAVAPYDAFGNSILPQNYCYRANTLTTLAADLIAGATTITLTDATNWDSGASYANRNIIFWDYTDAAGKLWPVNTYSRNELHGSGTTGAWAQGGITGNVITLVSPYAGPTHLAGTQVSNTIQGGAYMYSPQNVVVPTTWTQYSGITGGVNNTGTTSVFANGFPPGTATVKVGFLLNYPPSNPSDIAVAGISLSDTSAASYDANHVTSAMIVDGTIVHTDVATANRDGVAATPSLRTLGTGAQQAAAGNHTHVKANITDFAHTHPVTDMTATGTRDATTFLRGDNAWAAPVSAPSTVTAARIYKNVDQSVGGGGSNVGVQFQVTDYSSPSTFADVANNRLVIPTTGIYMITFYSSWQAPGSNVSGVRDAFILINGTNVRLERFFSTTNIIGNATATTIRSCVAGDLISAQVSNSLGVASILNSTSNATALEAAYLGPLGP